MASRDVNQSEVKRIISMVRKIASVFKVKVVITDLLDNAWGEVDYDNVTGRPTTLTLATHWMRGKRMQIVKPTDICTTAFHEIAHIMQGARRDKDLYATMHGITALEINARAEAGTKLPKDMRDWALTRIWRIEREAEEFGLEMAEKFGLKLSRKKEIRASTSSLMCYILTLRYGLPYMCPYKRRKVIKSLPFKYDTIPELDDLIKELDKIHLK